MVSSVSGAAGYSPAAMCGAKSRGPVDPAAMQEKLFNKLDVNGDGGIDQAELGDFLKYVSSATGSTTETDASQLFETLDSDGDGSISKQDFSDGVKNLFDALRSQLGSSSSERTAPVEDAGAPGLDQLFAALDQNGDGTISQDELGTFMSQKSEHSPRNGEPGRPGGSLFSRIDILIDQYRANATGAESDEANATSTVSAVA